MPRASALGLSVVAAVTFALATTHGAIAKKRKPDPRARALEALGAAVHAFQSGDYPRAHALTRKLRRAKLANADYVLYIAAQSASLIGEHEEALEGFRALAKRRGSRFSAVASWRIADCQWALGNQQTAREAYERLLRSKLASVGDKGLARFRIAEANRLRKREKQARKQLREILLLHPGHPMAARAEARLRELGGAKAVALSARDHIARAKRLTSAHHWHEAIAELRRSATTSRRRCGGSATSGPA